MSANLIDFKKLEKLGLEKIEEYKFNDMYSSFIYKKGDTCYILDQDIQQNKTKNALNKETFFDYSKYCEMQNKYMHLYKKLFRINLSKKEDYQKIKYWMDKKPEEIITSDNAGTLDWSHIDNTYLEKEFEDIFSQCYGNDSIKYLKKEYSISLDNNRKAFVDYVIESKKQKFAIEENGVQYHHPLLVSKKTYENQLEKQNTLSLYNFKTFRFSSENLIFKDQIIDNLKEYFGEKDNFISNFYINEKRPFKLYVHQQKVLSKINEERSKGINTSLIVLPTGSGKSQIVLEDLEQLSKQKKIKRALIMVSTKVLKNDWLKRIRTISSNVNIDVKFYNTVYLELNILDKKYYNYIVFDEAHHAQAANCRKTLNYFIPKYLIGLTATPERLDMKKLDEIFGKYETNLTLKEAIEQNIVSNIRCFRLISNIDLSNVRYNGKDYNYADLEKTLLVDSRNNLIVETLVKYFSQSKNFKQGIIFCVNIDHAKRLEKILNERGITSKAVYGSNKENNKIFEEYKEKKIQFLLSCQLINEGWDSPQTEVIVMARPTLSKVLYLQQLGRGLRKFPGKESLIVIDVVDNYQSKMVPWSFNSLFKIKKYSHFQGVINKNYNEILEIYGLSEKEIKMSEIDVFTFEEKYKDYLSLEQAARELFIGTMTLNKWVKQNKNIASLYLPIGSKLLPYFSKNDILKIRKIKNLKIHNNETILNDFLEFINKNTLTYSFKLVFLKYFLLNCDEEGEIKIDILLDKYINFYKERIRRKKPVDRKGCIYTEEYLQDITKMKRSMLKNPFEKFERKRFIYYSKDLSIICFNPILWKQLTTKIRNDLIKKIDLFLKNYYKNLGGLCE